MAGGTEELEAAIAPVCASVGVELVDVELAAGTLQVTVERLDGLDLDVVADAARAISEVLDGREDLAPDGHYELEVSSPGLERRLRRPEHFRRVIGSTISLRTQPGTDGPRRLEGRLTSADDSEFVVTAEDGTEHGFHYDDVERARTVFDWQAALREDRRKPSDAHVAPKEAKTQAKREGGQP